VCLDTDTQGYFLPSHNVTDTYTPQELTALSWSAFQSEILSEIDATFRIQALDSADLFERLKLASYLLKQKENQLKARMKKAGLPLRGEEGSEDEESQN
jgi:hypothetical protein